MSKFRTILSAINTPGFYIVKTFISFLEPFNHNEFTVKDSLSFAKEITKYGSSLFMARLYVEPLFTNNLLKEIINNSFSDLHKIYTMGNSTNLTCSNFWKQQLVNLLLFLIFFYINKQTEQIWTPLLAPHQLMPWYVITKKSGQTIVHPILNILYTKGMLTVFLLFFISFFLF